MHLEYSLQNIFDASGFVLSAIGMAIVFASLTVITLFIAGIPRFLELLDRWTNRATRKVAKDEPAPAAKSKYENEVLAAIAAVIEHELRRPDGSDPLRLTLHRQESGSFWGRAGRMRTFSAHDLAQR